MEQTEQIEQHVNKEIFVFGSNEAGRHGSGAALYAKDYCGAEPGVGMGRTGDSYAIPTKDYLLRKLSLGKVHDYILNFLDYAEEHPELTFKVSAIGTGLAGFSHEEMTEVFSNAPDNCLFDERWAPWLLDKKFWGAYE